MDKLFKIDPHTHTDETSKCGHLSGTTLAELYHALGYDAIVVTDHLHEEYISSLYCKDDWDACVAQFLQGYKKAAKRGAKLGLNVIFGVEIRFNEPNGSDYLLYGIDEDFLRKNPYFYRLTPWEFFKCFGDEILIIQAHPFRNGGNTVFIECIHGIELINTNRRHINHTDKGQDLCGSNPEFYKLSGSDAHREEDVGGAWMLFDENISDSYEFAAALKRGGYSLGHEERKRFGKLAEIRSLLECKPRISTSEEEDV